MKILKTEKRETASVYLTSNKKDKVAVEHEKITVDTIDIQDKIEFNCDVDVEGDIVSGADVTVHCGDLSVGGNVGSNVNVHMDQDLHVLKLRKDDVPFNLPHNFIVRRNLGSHVKVEANHAGLTIGGNTGAFCDLSSKGQINTAGDVADHCKYTSNESGIAIGKNVGPYTELIATGNVYGHHISVGKHVGAHAKLETKNADICVNSADQTAKLKTVNGKIDVTNKIDRSIVSLGIFSDSAHNQVKSGLVKIGDKDFTEIAQAVETRKTSSLI